MTQPSLIGQPFGTALTQGVGCGPPPKAIYQTQLTGDQHVHVCGCLVYGRWPQPWPCEVVLSYCRKLILMPRTFRQA